MNNRPLVIKIATKSYYFFSLDETNKCYFLQNDFISVDHLRGIRKSLNQMLKSNGAQPMITINYRLAKHPARLNEPLQPYVELSVEAYDVLKNTRLQSFSDKLIITDNTDNDPSFPPHQTRELITPSLALEHYKQLSEKPPFQIQISEKNTDYLFEYRIHCYCLINKSPPLSQSHVNIKQHTNKYFHENFSSITPDKETVYFTIKEYQDLKQRLKALDSKLFDTHFGEVGVTPDDFTPANNNNKVSHDEPDSLSLSDLIYSEPVNQITVEVKKTTINFFTIPAPTAPIKATILENKRNLHS